MKRFLWISVALGALLLIGVVVIQTPPILTRLVNLTAGRLSRQTPYDVRIERLAGNILFGFTAKRIHLERKTTHAEVLLIDQLDVDLHWLELLFHKQIAIKRLVVTMTKQGKAVAEGSLRLQPVVVGNMKIQDAQFPLGKFAALGGWTLPLPLIHTGSLTFEKSKDVLNAQMNGRLDDAILDVQGSWPLAGMNINGHAQIRTKNANAHVILKEGVGTYQIRTNVAGGMSRIRGDVNLPDQFIKGYGQLSHLDIQDAYIDKADVSFFMNAKNQSLTFIGSGLQMRKGIDSPFDPTSIRLSLRGLQPEWKTTATVLFRNKTTTTVTGDLSKREEAWCLAWKSMVFSSPLAGTWTTTRPGTLAYQQGSLSIHGLHSVNGEQVLDISNATWEAPHFQLNAALQHVDPAPWAAMFAPELTLKGKIDASVHMEGTTQHPYIAGYIKGDLPTVDVSSIGLSLSDVRMDLRCQGQRLNVVQFSGKTRRGEMSITGSSLLPKLAYTLKAHRLVLEPREELHAVLDVDLDLKGTLASPVLTGTIGIPRATYRASKKKDDDHREGLFSKSSSSATEVGNAKTTGNEKSTNYSHAEMAIDVSWPRNVWYRDGISSIETRGDLRVIKHAEEPDVILTGTVSSIRGSYNYYGRDFKIESGQVQFTGTRELNPLIAVDASYSAGATTVYLDFTGSWKEPVFKMHSTPPLSDKDIVSVIVFGQPLNELRGRTGGASENQQLMQAAGGVLGSYISKELNKTGNPLLNVDMLNIQPDSTGGSQVTVGRYLTRKLFISYGQTVHGSAQKTLTADYFLTDKWTLQGASDSATGNYMDFLFRYPLNKKGAGSNSAPLPNSPFRQTLDPNSSPTQFRNPLQ